MHLRWKVVTVGCLALASIVGINHFRLNRIAAEAMEFRDVSVLSYYRYGVVPDSIVLDIRDVGPESSAARTIGGLIEYADALSDRGFREVVLAWNGEARFILEGHDFKVMGREAAYQNPVYTVRTLPEKLRKPDGSPAFSTWTGGMLGVLGAQMDDVNAFAEDWYIRDALKGL